MGAHHSPPIDTQSHRAAPSKAHRNNTLRAGLVPALNADHFAFGGFGLYPFDKGAHIRR